MISKLILILLSVKKTLSEKNYKYYELSLQKWCTKDYQIHGLWPQYNSSYYPTYCKNVTYHQPKGELLNELNKYWNSCDNTLWEHEWKKHGSCIQYQNNISENDYFNNTVQLLIKNKNLINQCNQNSDNCILSCFDLDYNNIDC